MTATLIRRLAPVLLLMLGVQAQGPTGDFNPTPLPETSTQKVRATISGQVIDAVTGKPLKKVWIVARNVQGRHAPVGAVTDGEGNFTIKDVDAARYMLSATKTGYVSQQYGQRTGGRPGMPLNAELGGDIKNVNFKLQPGGVISGRVLDEDGEPVSNVQMMLLRYAYMDGERRLMPANGTRTDDRGEYRIFGLRTGKYYLSASLRNMPIESMSGTGPVEEGYAPTFYPGVNDLSSAQAIELKAGSEERADLTFLPTRTFRVRGRLIDGTTGEAAKSANVALIRKGQLFGMGMMGGGFNSQVSSNDGRFEVRGVTPGSYYITAMQWQRDGGGVGSMARLELEVGESDVENITLTTQPTRTFNGTLRVEGTPADFKLANVNIWMQAAEGARMFFGPSQGSVKDDGTFQLKNLTDEDYSLRVNGITPDMYLKSARVGSDDVLENGFNPARVKGNSLDIVVRAGAAELEGVVKHDDKGFGGAMVALVPEYSGKGKPQRAKVATSDSDGKFKIRGIRPGRYRVYAFEEIESGAYDDPEYMRKFRDEGQSLDFAENAKRTETLKLIPAGTEQ